MQATNYLHISTSYALVREIIVDNLLQIVNFIA